MIDEPALTGQKSAKGARGVKSLGKLSFLALMAATVSLVPDKGAAAAPEKRLNQPTWSTTEFPKFDRERLPEALRDVPLERLSSGALMRLDRDGDLVQLPVASPSSGDEQQATAVTLDLRVGANIRLGDDPAALPSNLRAQAEPHIARAPGDPDFLIATFQEGRFTGGGAVDCGFSVSHNGGLTWTRALIPNLSTASGGTYDRATDPVAGIDLNGNAYLNTLGLKNSQVSDGTVLVSRSSDGGNTFGNPMIAYKPPSTAYFPDKNWMAVNNFNDTSAVGRLIVTFTLFSNVGGRATPIMRVLSDDGGVTWNTPAFVHASNYEVQGSQPVFLPGGKLAIIYWNFNFTDDFFDDFLELVVSTDGGVTFGAPKFITGVAIYGPAGIRTGAFLPSATTDNVTGNLYVVYQASHEGAPRILFTKSSDAGDTWTTPVPISDNPAFSGVFNPAISASPDGQTLTVVFYDQRHATNSTGCDMYFAQSFDGGATWQPNIRLTSVTSDAALAPQTPGGYMLGDYLGVAGPISPNVPAVPVWVDTRTGNPDPFVTRIGIAPQVNFNSWQAARLSLGQINNPQLGGEAGDLDGDGEDNLSEFRSLTDPANASSVFHSGRQLNISTRLLVQIDDNVLIGGFIVTGSEAKTVIVRGLGPSLTSSSVQGELANPIIELYQGNTPIATNDDWDDTQAAEIEATTLAPTNELESAIVRTLDPGQYTVILRGSGNATGIGLVEVYDLNRTANSQLANISTRGLVGTGDDVMIGGLIVGGGLGTNESGNARVVVRALGPSLTQAGVTGALQDPELQLFDANGSPVASNDNWKQTQQTEIQNAGLALGDDRESAIVAVLAKGNHTALVRGKNGETGIALVEAYNVH